MFLTISSPPLIISNPLSPLRGIARMLFALVAGKNLHAREERFQILIRDYHRVISGICFSYSQSSEEYKDLHQDILVNIWKGLDYFRGDSSPSTWIYRVALNTCVSTIRKRSRRPSTLPLSPTLERSDEDISDFRERIDWLHTAISMLSPIDKAVVTMWLDEQSYEEIAEVVGITRGNVAVRLNRIKKRLAGMQVKI